MNSIEKEISYQTTNTYSTKNTLSHKTKNIWFACHGMGYLSRYFINYFNDLDPNENYIIAPQAQSKFYQNTDFKHVGANWLTKDNTVKDNENIMRYFDAIFEKEQLISHKKNLIVFGFSQGVSVAMRYIAKRKLQCAQIVLYAGKIPVELKATDFNFLENHTKVSLIYGTKDHYITKNIIASEKESASQYFGSKLRVIPFDGSHEIKKDIIKALV